MLPCRTELFYKYAKVDLFFVLFYTMTCLHCAASSYFVGTARAWKDVYSLSETATSWILHSKDILTGSFAILVAFFGNQVSRPIVLGSLCCIQAVSGINLFIPEFYHENNVPQENVSAFSFHNLCSDQNKTIHDTETIGDTKITTILVLLFYQLCVSLTTISIWCHGLTYCDDHIKTKNVVFYIGVLLMVCEFGNYIGMYFTLIPTAFLTPIFQSFAWIFIMMLIFVLGVTIALFPRWLPTKNMEQGVATLLHISEPLNKFTYDKSPPLKRIFTNKVLLMNVTSATFLNAAWINFKLLEKDFYRARFLNFSLDQFLSYEDFDLKNITAHATNPVSIFTLLGVTLFMRKYSPHIRTMSIYVIFCYTAIAGIFLTFAFIKCDKEYFSTFQNDACNVECNCNLDHFEPVCMKSGMITFYSPCFAGCKTFNGTLYADCGCCKHMSDVVYPGGCSYNFCSSFKLLASCLGICRHSLTYQAYMIHLLIAIRAVAECDKAISMGQFLTFTKLLPLIPTKFAYDIFKDSMCVAATSKSGCTTYKLYFATILSSITISQITVAIMLLLPLVYYIGPLNVYNTRWAYGDFVFMHNRDAYFQTSLPSKKRKGAKRPNSIANIDESIVRHVLSIPSCSRYALSLDEIINRPSISKIADQKRHGSMQKVHSTLEPIEEQASTSSTSL